MVLNKIQPGTLLISQQLLSVNLVNKDSLDNFRLNYGGMSDPFLGIFDSTVYSSGLFSEGRG